MNDLKDLSMLKIFGDKNGLRSTCEYFLGISFLEVTEIQKWHIKNIYRAFKI